MAETEASKWRWDTEDRSREKIKTTNQPEAIRDERLSCYEFANDSHDYKASYDVHVDQKMKSDKLL